MQEFATTPIAAHRLRRAQTMNVSMPARRARMLKSISAAEKQRRRARHAEMMLNRQMSGLLLGDAELAALKRRQSAERRVLRHDVWRVRIRKTRYENNPSTGNVSPSKCWAPIKPKRGATNANAGIALRQLVFQEPQPLPATPLPATPQPLPATPQPLVATDAPPDAPIRCRTKRCRPEVETAQPKVLQRRRISAMDVDAPPEVTRLSFTM